MGIEVAGWNMEIELVTFVWKRQGDTFSCNLFAETFITCSWMRELSLSSTTTRGAIWALLFIRNARPQLARMTMARNDLLCSEWTSKWSQLNTVSETTQQAAALHASEGLLPQSSVSLKYCHCTSVASKIMISSVDYENTMDLRGIVIQNDG